MFDLIPKAYAQSTVKDAANAGADAAASGVEGLVRYVINNIDNWIAGIVVVFIFFLLSKMAAKAIKEKMLHQKGEDIQEASLLLVERITVISITGVGITIALAINGLNFTAVVGAFSLGIGFALKDIIGNFMSGIIMLSQDKFKIGHFIKTSEGMGKIVSIDTRATVLKAINGTEVVIPNQNMLNQSIINYSINPFRRIELITYVSWGSDLSKAMDLIHGVLDANEEILKNPKSNVFLHNLEDEANLVIRVLFWVETGKKWLKIRSDVHRAILSTFAANGIDIDYTVRTLKLDKEDRSYFGGALGISEPANSLPAEVSEQEVANEANAMDLTLAAETAQDEKETAEILEQNAAQMQEANTEMASVEQGPVSTEANLEQTNAIPEPTPAPETLNESERPTPPPTHL